MEYTADESGTGGRDMLTAARPSSLKQPVVKFIGGFGDVGVWDGTRKIPRSRQQV